MLLVKFVHERVGAAGAEVSRIISSVMSALVFHRPSRNLIYTIFVQSHAVNVRATELPLVVRLVGDALFPYAISTPPNPVSTAEQDQPFHI